jgi:serine protease Do
MLHGPHAKAFKLGFALLLLAQPQFSRAADETAPVSGGPKTAQQIMDAARDSIVVIHQTGRDRGKEGIGTGFVVGRDGLIATCMHVIGEGRPLTVTFNDGKSAAVTEVHAWDRKLDLAVIRVDARDIPALRLGDSDNLKQGASVVAIGNPQGLTHSIVQGVVSAIREFDFGPMIQLAIPIEPGNSGGPLLQMNGRVHGIVNMKSAVTDNLGFAIPINSLKGLLEHPNPVPIEKWLALGALNEDLWKPLMGAHWWQKPGTITVDGSGQGFGGRALCLWQKNIPEPPYEIAVNVRLDDESGAAGLVFGSDGGDLHYGFYPSARQLRLTRFDGPNVFTWTILKQIDTPYYHPGEWNRLKVRVEPEKILCYVNGNLVAEADEPVARHGKVGLAKFRNTTAQFRSFRVAKQVEPAAAYTEDKSLRVRLDKSLSDEAPMPEDVLKDSTATRALLLEMAREWDQKATSARKFARELTQKSVQKDLLDIFEKPEVDLFAAAFQIARVESPDLELAAYREELDSIAHSVSKRFAADSTHREKLDLLRKYLFEENGFHGSRSDYYSRANSFINRVLEDHEGIPITLSVLFLELGAKLGIEKLDGMPFPGHFMVRFKEQDAEPVYIDVFDGGKLYRKNELFDLISNHSEVPLLDEHFKPATKKDIIVRMLKNLIGSSPRTAERALPYLNLLLALSPDDPLEHWRRASFRLESGERAQAREDLRWLIEHRPTGLDLDRVEELYRSLQN